MLHVCPCVCPVLLVSQVVERLQHFAPLQVGEEEVPTRQIHQQALELAEAAANGKTLCRMDPTWHPWF